MTVRIALVKALELGTQGRRANERPGTGFFKTARAECQSAKSALAGFDPDPYWAAQIEQCYGYLAADEGNRRLACTHLARASALMGKADADRAGVQPGIISVRKKTIDQMRE